MTDANGVDIPFVGKGGLPKAWQVFGEPLDGLLAEMNEELVA